MHPRLKEISLQKRKFDSWVKKEYPLLQSRADIGFDRMHVAAWFDMSPYTDHEKFEGKAISIFGRVQFDYY